MDRHIYDALHLTIAQHPSETNERMMIRLLAFALNASEHLQFTKGLCADDEPELWCKNYSEEIELWIDLGLPDEKRIRKATARAQQVILYTYGGRAADIWFEGIKNKLSRYQQLKIIALPETVTETMANMAARGMDLQCTIEDGEVWLSDMQQEVRFTPNIILEN